MTTEIRMLAWSIIVGLVSVLLAGALKTHVRGVAWNVGNRDQAGATLTGVSGRAERAARNFLETFPFFAAAVLAVVTTQRNSPQSALGAQLYFWGRLVYLPVYLIGIPYLRSLVWGVSFVGLIWVLARLL